MSQETSAPSPSVNALPAPLAPATATGAEFPRPSLTCSLTSEHPYSPNLEGRAHLPVLASFGAGPLHAYLLNGDWDLKKAVSDHADSLLRSVCRNYDDGNPVSWDDLTFQFGPRAFVYVDDHQIKGYATTPQDAEDLARKFDAAYRKPPEPTGGVFHLIKSGREISSEVVPLEPETVLAEETFRLHYGEAGWAWHQDYTAKFAASHHGLSILEGAPGTGKTSYLRHLMGVSQETHRFYFVPPATLNILSSPDFIGFWADQRRRHRDRRFVVLLEDADGALMTRDSDNRAHVSAILNLSDGMLADFLRLHIICTINCRTTDIDQALLRPGRLLCHHLFGRLDYAHASRLAEHIGKRLTDVRDYSLAEVFAEHGHAGIIQPRIGFAR